MSRHHRYSGMAKGAVPWERVRRQALDRDGHRCQTLWKSQVEVHHLMKSTHWQAVHTTWRCDLCQGL